MKKHKKQKNKQPVKKQKSNLTLVSAVSCPKGMLVSLPECKSCDNHNNMDCMLMGKARKIEVLPMMHPMMFNRMTFQYTSDQIREESINYYFKTDIMNSVNRITGYPNYTQYKRKYLQGAFVTNKQEAPGEVLPFDQFTIMLFLQETKEVANCDMMLDGRIYSITNPFNQPGEWKIGLYLYNTFTLEGFADLKINGIGYKAMTRAVSGYQPDYVVAINSDKAIIGKITRHA